VQNDCCGLPLFSGEGTRADKASLRLIVIPAKAGIHRQYEAWIPAFAGMTIQSL